MGGPTHRQSGTATYKAWLNMIARCENPSVERYPRYGGRGIRVCDEWRRSFEAFVLSVGPKPSRAHTLERMDVNGDYRPGNVRWATQREQARNRASNHRVTVGGETLTVAEWAERTGINRFTIYKRIGKQGWAAERAVTEPTHPNHGRTA